VAFLCTEERRGKKIPGATGFFLGMDCSEQPDMYYVATARHVIDMSRPYGRLYLRVNKSIAGVDHVEVPHDSWVFHPSSDVAVFPLTLSPQDYEYVCVPSSYLLSSDELSHKPHVHVGTQIVTIGLFRKYYGQDRLQSVVRFGRISSMPDEKVPIELSPGCQPVMIDAYLAEMLSWGGESGSPVFTYGLGVHGPEALPMSYQNPKVVGLLHGHYPLEEKIKPVGSTIESVDLNSGIAVVILSQAIIETLELPQLQQERSEATAKAKKGSR